MEDLCKETLEILLKGHENDLNSGNSGWATKTILKSLINSLPDGLAYPKVEPGYPLP